MASWPSCLSRLKNLKQINKKKLDVCCQGPGRGFTILY